MLSLLRAPANCIGVVTAVGESPLVRRRSAAPAALEKAHGNTPCVAATHRSLESSLGVPQAIEGGEYGLPAHDSSWPNSAGTAVGCRICNFVCVKPRALAGFPPIREARGAFLDRLQACPSAGAQANHRIPLHTTRRAPFATPAPKRLAHWSRTTPENVGFFTLSVAQLPAVHTPSLREGQDPHRAWQHDGRIRFMLVHQKRHEFQFTEVGP